MNTSTIEEIEVRELDISIPYVLKPVVLFVTAVILLRISGRRSIAQMTIAQTVVIISMGAMIVEPFADKSVVKTALIATIYVVLLLIFEFFEFHSKKFSKAFVGRAIVIVQDGVLDERNLKKIKLTKEELNSRLRQLGLCRLSDLKQVTLEYNGELGYELKKGANPITVDDMEFIINHILSKEQRSQPVDLAKELKQYKEEFSEE